MSDDDAHGDDGDRFRPRLHFTPPAGWMNDPNGLVFHDGEYHLFYQHLWPRHWGHAVSRDLARWEHLPVALSPDDRGDIWSGSAVTADDGRLAAVFTQWKDSAQRQSLAFSGDRGRTWAMHPGNPVLADPARPDFRDPKVFRHAPSGRWVMVLATGRTLSFFSSPDLLTWERTGEFTAPPDAGVWECPDLYPLPRDGDPARVRWVLHASWLDQAIFSEGRGGAGTRYFVGEFDGRTFTPDPGGEAGHPLAHGPDDYAGVTWDGAPDGQRLLVAWMSHWVYAKHAPTGAWQGAMTCPRELTLRSTPAGPRLFQSPAREWDALRAGAPSFAGDVTLGPEPVALPAPYLAFEIIAEIEPGGASGEVVCFRLWRGADGRGTVVGWDGRTGELFVDRRRAAGPAALGPQFFARYAAPLPPAPDGRVRLRLLVDACSVEAFGNGGAACLTALVFPEPGDTGLEAYATGGTARLHALTLAPLTAP